MAGDIHKVAWLHVVDRRLLCVRHANGRQFYLPGGLLGDDAPKVTLRREVVGQVGVSLDVDSMALAGIFSVASDEDPVARVSTSAFYAISDDTPSTSATIAELAFFGSWETRPISTLTRRVIAELETLDVID